MGAGAILGLAFGHGAAEALGTFLAKANQWPVTGWTWVATEIWIVAGALVLGIATSLVPALRAYRRDPAILLLGR